MSFFYFKSSLTVFEKMPKTANNVFPPHFTELSATFLCLKTKTIKNSDNNSSTETPVFFNKMTSKLVYYTEMYTSFLSIGGSFA